MKKLSLFQWLLIITVLYLFWQISLSGAILIADTEDASRRLSELAKLTVGFGTALFVFRATFRKKGWLIALVLSLPLGYGAILLEDTIVNHFAERTTGQERLEARTILLFNTALIKGGAALPDLNKNIADNAVKLAAFTKILGFAIWNNPALMSQIMQMGQSLLVSLHGQQAYDKADREYERYVEAFKASSASREEAERQIKQLNFAAWLSNLNKILAEYAGCIDESCRNRIQSRVDQFVRQGFGNLNLKLKLNDFCRKEKGTGRYHMGKMIDEGEMLLCSSTESEFYNYIMKQIDELKMANAPEELKQLPASISSRILSSTLMCLKDWREMWAKYIDSEFAAKGKKELTDPARFAHGGAEAETGRNYAISVFLPPVALGFSVTVCFLHIASLLSALTRKPKICGLIAAVIYCLPAIFGTATPLSGLAGIYAKWLIAWEGMLYPFGIFRWLIL